MTVALVAFLLSLVLTGLAGWYARRRGVLSVPEERSSHQTAIPSGGGLGIVATWLLVSLVLLYDTAPAVWTFAILPAALILAIIGWADDLNPISARLRFAVQLTVSFGVLAFSWYTGLERSIALLILGGIWLIWNANMYNFMDGSHGMAGAQGVFSGLVLAWLYQRGSAEAMSQISLVVAAACMGFLPWNLARRRVFMGDVGSVPLGFVLACLGVFGVISGAMPVQAAVLVLSVFMVDAGLTLVWRVLKGERWYTAHRQHLYQQLIARGWSHESVLVLYMSINIVMVLPAVVVTVRSPNLAWAVATGLVATMIVGWILAIRRFGVTA